MPASTTRPIRRRRSPARIGGNVAENSGGVHCLKYGMTTNNVLGCEIVLMNGEILRIGGKAAEDPRLRPDGHHHRLRRPARRHHRGHGADPAEAGDGARADGRFFAGGGRRRMRGARSSAPASFPAAWR